ncbi:VCBS repeat-containing protein [bacterium]|nr:VCBS repeat-containing protein [bacterium]
MSSISSSFNGTPILRGNFIWFSAAMTTSGIPATGAKVYFSASTVSFMANDITYHLRVPSSVVTYSSSATKASTVFDGETRTWQITAPTSGLSGNVLLSGLAYQVPVDLPRGINPIAWTGTFGSDMPGLSVKWHWGAAVYTYFTSNLAALGLKTVDDPYADSQYSSSDPAGTPEKYASFVTGGATGGGGANYTGEQSGNATVSTFGPPVDFSSHHRGGAEAVDDVNGQPNFGSSGPRRVVVTDVNGDGRVDLLVADGGLALHAGLGNGRFGPRTALSASFAADVVIGDLNGDGFPDLVAPAGNYLLVFLGDGRGGFSLVNQFFAGDQGVASLALVDVDGDGLLDIVATEFGTDLDVWYGTGGGNFTSGTPYPVDTTAGPVAVADLNGDGRPDAVIATSNGVAVLLNKGGRAFASAMQVAVGAPIFQIALGDMNGDGKIDIVAAEDLNANVYVLLGTGTGRFKPPLGFAAGGTGQYGIALGDLNGDGKLDVVVISRYQNSASILFGTGTGALGAPLTFFTGVLPTSVTIADVNGDGKPDVLVPAREDITVLISNGDGTFVTTPTFDFSAASLFPNAVRLADLNGDGKLDVVTANAMASVSVALGMGNGDFGPSTQYAAGSARDVAVGDVNGDGKLDLVTANSPDNTVSVLAGNGDGTFGPPTSFPAGSEPCSVVISDANGDGLPDRIVANAGSRNVSVLISLGGGQFAPAVNYSTNGTPSSVVAGDLNGDTKPDIIVACLGTDTVSVFLNAGNGTFAAPQMIGGFGGPCSLALADLNGDGRLDLVVANGRLRSVAILLARIIHECSRLVHQVGYQFAATIASALAWAP